ncbi:hypothetical protein DBL02_05630 [Acinetobacter oleivorans]|nr:hypothetical protein DBL02_05630 [Acinetobacter oleivorans]
MAILLLPVLIKRIILFYEEFDQIVLFICPNRLIFCKALLFILIKQNFNYKKDIKKKSLTG